MTRRTFIVHPATKDRGTDMSDNYDGPQMAQKIIRLREENVRLRTEKELLREQRDGLAAVIGTVRQMLPLPLRNVSDIPPESHWEEIGEAIDSIKQRAEAEVAKVTQQRDDLHALHNRNAAYAEELRQTCQNLRAEVGQISRDAAATIGELEAEKTAAEKERNDLLVVCKALVITWGDKFSPQIKEEFRLIEQRILNRARHERDKQ